MRSFGNKTPCGRQRAHASLNTTVYASTMQRTAFGTAFWVGHPHPTVSGLWDDPWVIHMYAITAYPGLGEILGKGLAISSQCHYNMVISRIRRKSRDFFGLQRKLNASTTWPTQDRARFRS